MKKISTIFLLMWSISSNSHAQIAGNHLYNQDNNGYKGYHQQPDVNLNLDPVYNHSFSNYLEANVMMNVKASAFVAIFSITQHASTIEDADKMMQVRIDAFKARLTGEEMSAERIFVDPISMVPTYATEFINKKFSKTFNEIPTGFELKKNIHITFNRHDYINRIITLAAQSEIYDLVKADYVIDGLEDILVKLRDEAIGILLHKKLALEKAGLTTKFVQMGEKYGSAYPAERYRDYMAYKSGTPQYYVSYHKTNREVQYQYNYAEKQKTIYYEKVSDKQFDKVINPVVGEPMVQVYLSVKGSYQLFDPVADVDDKAYKKRMRDIGEKEALLRLVEKEKMIQQIGKKPVK